MEIINQTKAAYTPKTSRLTYRLWAYFLTFLTVIMPVAPSMAAQLADSQIQYEFDLDPVYERLTSPDFQYRAPSYIESSTPSATSIAEFYEQIEADYKVGLGEPTWVPISGDITLIIPVYPQYKYIGTPLVQSRYIRTQVNSLLGRTLIDSTNPAYQTEAAQLNTLYNNAFTYMQNTPGLVFGDKLNRDQDGSGLLQDLVWPELRVVNGEEVIVPVLYLTQGTIDQQRVEDNVTTFNGNVSVGSLTIEGVTINTGRDTFIQVANHLVNDGGTISSPGELKIVTGGTFANLSGLVEAASGDLIIGAHSVQNRTIVYRYDTGNDQGYRYGDVASINAADGSVVLRSYSDIIFSGAETSANNGELTLVADGSIYIGAQQLYEGHSSRGGRTTRSSVSYLQSTLSATDTIKLIAQGEIKIEASEIVSDEGHIELLAGLGITVEDELASTRSYKKGTYGRKSVEESAYQTVAIRSVLDAGKGIRLHTGLGDITLKAADITSTEGASVTASGGAINMLMAVETDHYSYSSIKKSLFTVKTVNRGHNIETAVPNTIIGGFQAEALYGLNVEYEGNPDLTFDEQVSELSQMPGMAWMDEIRNDPAYADVDWEEVNLVYDTWDKTSTTLSPAALAVLTIVVAVVTAGTGVAAAAGAAAGGGTFGAAVGAAVTSLISQTAIAVANGAVNGDIGGALEDLASEDTLKSVAIAMVTAAAISYVDTEFFTPTNEELVNIESTAREAASNLPGATSDTISAAGEIARETAMAGSLAQQAIQAATHASVTAAATTVVNGGSLDDFGDAFVQSLAQNAISVIGENLAREIGVAKYNGNIDTALQYVAHAGVGCLTGTLTTRLQDGDTELGCVSGAGGAVIGEFIAQGYEEGIQDDLEEWISTQTTGGGVVDEAQVMQQALEFKRRGVDLARLGSALTAFALGGDVTIAAETGANAAENNALFLITVIAVAAYTSYVSYQEGGLYEGLQSIGRGDDPLSLVIGAVAEEGIELFAEEFPEAAQETADILNAVGEEISAGVKVVLETEAGETVVRYWNEIPEEDRNALIGAGSVVSMVIPAGVVGKLKALKNTDVELGDWVKDKDHPNWDKFDESEREILESEHEYYEVETVDDLVTGGSPFDSVSDRIDLDDLHDLSNKDVGEIGEEVAENMLRDSGYDVDNMVVIKNASDNGIDIIARAPDGSPVFIEVKASRVGRIGDLSPLQSDSDSYVRGLLDEGGVDGTVRGQSIPLDTQERIFDLRDEVLNSPGPTRTVAIGIDLLNEEITVSPW